MRTLWGRASAVFTPFITIFSTVVAVVSVLMFFFTDKRPTFDYLDVAVIAALMGLAVRRESER